MSSISSSDWKFGAEQFVKRLPGKVYVHRELIQAALLSVYFSGCVIFIMEMRRCKARNIFFSVENTKARNIYELRYVDFSNFWDYLVV